MATTMGQAIDTAIKRHCELYPESEVYSARVYESETKNGTWRVEVRAKHFSATLRYSVSSR
jgi:hypothetical protein